MDIYIDYSECWRGSIMVELRQADEKVEKQRPVRKKEAFEKMLRTLLLLVIVVSAYYTQKVAQCLREDLMGNNDSHNHLSKRYLAP